MNFWKTAFAVALGIVLAVAVIAGSLTLWTRTMEARKFEAEVRADLKISDLTPDKLRQLCGAPTKEEKSDGGGVKVVTLRYELLADPWVEFPFMEGESKKGWISLGATNSGGGKRLEATEVLRRMPCIEHGPGARR